MLGVCVLYVLMWHFYAPMSRDRRKCLLIDPANALQATHSDPACCRTTILRGASNCCLPFEGMSPGMPRRKRHGGSGCDGASPDLQTLSPRDPNFALD